MQVPNALDRLTSLPDRGDTDIQDDSTDDRHLARREEMQPCGDYWQDSPVLRYWRSAVTAAALHLGADAAARFERTEAPHGDTVVQIDNQNFNDMNIYLLDEGNRVFLGAVNGLSTGTLAIPRAAGSSSFRVQLLADPIGSSIPITTPSLSVGPGQTVYWTIGTTASNSFASAD